MNVYYMFVLLCVSKYNYPGETLEALQAIV
jgi:hypothetical protein